MKEEIKKKRRKVKEKGYLSNKQMFEEVLICQKLNKVSDKLGGMFMILSRKYSSKPNFSGYSYRDELINFGIIACVGALHKFKATTSENPFSYYTSIIHNAFVQVLNKEKRQQQIRDKILVVNAHNPSYSYANKEVDEYD